jgi:hypothetical protein
MTIMEPENVKWERTKVLDSLGANLYFNPRGIVTRVTMEMPHLRILMDPSPADRGPAKRFDQRYPQACLLAVYKQRIV